MSNARDANVVKWFNGLAYQDPEEYRCLGPGTSTGLLVLLLFAMQNANILLDQPTVGQYPCSITEEGDGFSRRQGGTTTWSQKQGQVRPSRATCL